ncbi:MULTISPECIES: hypothetical protein [Saccharopolyspora]|uniref:Uncharacterized protein n=1 Tax=Saccharopolyspora gregorii TaxID=33914 RepID=A0ABP6RXX2_9PSEU|nr:MULTISPECIES: hypothetical protein [unclassified Saccharopolyspora]MCA1186225.1 hypothetical protein [Saccharopolyspora sp. 6T]MCA1194639.1 hypothetical protein [Saccharopolyspora sp. 6V]MCA1229032.1 hypothetical protein [Saccharopolyspora sp. 6M]MCA1278427.1 hypothetical protein [Saccharopolyspora sp. 7B]
MPALLGDPELTALAMACRIAGLERDLHDTRPPSWNLYNPHGERDPDIEGEMPL